MEFATEGEIPVVFYDVGTAGGHVTKIRVNYRKGVQRVIDYLTALGHSDFGFIGHDSTLGPIAERCTSVVECAQLCNPRATVRQVTELDGLQGGKRAAAELPVSFRANDFVVQGIAFDGNSARLLDKTA